MQKEKRNKFCYELNDIIKENYVINFYQLYIIKITTFFNLNV